MGISPSARLNTEEPTPAASWSAANGTPVALSEPDVPTPSLTLLASATDEEFDSSLMVLISAGNDIAMATLYDRHCTFVYSIARRILEPSRAEECIHEVFMTLWREPEVFLKSRRGLQGTLALQTWEKATALRRVSI